jgi:vitamin B12/bleomycin/antimicrobial peptide transport system ATP-binding/permease protein
MAVTDTASDKARPAQGKVRAETHDGRFWVQALPLLRALNASTYRNKLALMAAGVALVILANAFGQIKLNAWLGSFYDTLVQRSLSTLAHELLVFLLIVGGLLCLVVAQTWLQETLKVKLREWLTHDLMDQWLKPKRAYLLAQTGEDGANPDQYIQADARHLAEMSASLAIGLFHATLLLVSFIGVLWALSSQVVFTWGDKSFTIPGYMVWCALAYAITGSWLTWLVGHPLIKLNAERYAREADLRFAIVRINETAETVALQRSEADERRTANGSIVSVIDLGCKLATGLSRLTWITSGYGWLAIIVPILVAVPGFFSGKLTLGGLMMVVGAFNQVQNSLRWFVDNFPGIADWRATLLRVSRFRNGLSYLDPEDSPSGITVGLHPSGQMSFENLMLTRQDSTISFATARIDMRQGERVLIESGADCDKSLLLRAMAGLWTEGTGSVLMPPAKALMVVPARAHFRIGTLREAMTYPAEAHEFDDTMISAALVRVGLIHLVEKLDERGRWDKALSGHEQHRLVLARLLLHRPDWVMFEDMAATANEQELSLLRSVFARELVGSAVIGVGSCPALDGFFCRRLRMSRYVDAIARPAVADVAITPPGRPLEAAE